MIRVNGKAFDIPDAVRGFQRFDGDARATHRASHRLGFRQRERIGEAFWTHALVPSVAYPTRAAARKAAIATLAHQPPLTPTGDKT